MNKEKLYQKVQALFPSELAVGDKIKLLEELRLDRYYGFIKEAELIIGEGILLHQVPKKVKLVRKNITLPIVLEAMNKKRPFMLQDEVPHYYQIELCSSDSWCIIQIINSYTLEPFKNELWQLRKDGKDLSLYDQSIDLIKLVYEVLIAVK